MQTTGLILVLHNHQPAGSADAVIRRAHDDCYRPLVDALERHPSIRVALHYTGPLLEWMEARAPETLQKIAVLAASGRVEIIGGGWQEPMLGVLPLRDAVGQLRMMKRECARLFGVLPRGMWLAERVWEPELAQTISQAGYSFTFLDDDHVRSAGRLQEHLTGHFTTEKGGHTLSIFPVSRALRAAIPSREPAEVLGVMAHLPGNVWTYGDDGENLGARPGTRLHVWENGWMERFLAALEQASASGRLTCHLPSSVLAETPSEGKIYIPTCAPRRMEAWSLPAPAAERLRDFEQSLEKTGLSEEGSAFVRGGTWTGFLAKYPESSLLHATMLHASRKVADRERGERSTMGAPSAETLAARRSLYRGQTHDPYWHGLSGGLYAPPLRKAAWHSLLLARRLTDPVTGPARLSTVDFDLDGREEILVEGEKLDVLLRPSAGAAAAFINVHPSEVNLVDVLGRRPEVYHRDVREMPSREDVEARGGSSAEELRRHPTRAVQAALAIDAAPRQAFHEIVLNREARLADAAAAGDIQPGCILADCRTRPFAVAEKRSDGGSAFVRATLRQEIYERLLDIDKVVFVDAARGSMAVHFTLRWNGEEPFEGQLVTQIDLSMPRFLPPDGIVTVEEPAVELRPEERHLLARGAWDGVSRVTVEGRSDDGVALRLPFQISPSCTLARYPVLTVSPSEAGYEAVFQGACLLVGWSLYLENWNEWKGRILMTVEQKA
jgi:hypothetical protein